MLDERILRFFDATKFLMNGGLRERLKLTRSFICAGSDLFLFWHGFDDMALWVPSPSNPSDSLSKGSCNAYDSSKRVGEGHLSKCVEEISGQWSSPRRVEEPDEMG